MTSTSPPDMPIAYDPSTVEDLIYKMWMDNGYFAPAIDLSKKPFVVIMPPPNVTGELHVGHALTAAIEDILVRWHRMRGEPTLWLPGKDHAGIATQVVVERELAKEGTSRRKLGRQKFEERMWEVVQRYGNTIDDQHKRLGASCDWSRLQFTLDPEPSKAVRTTFVNLYNKDLIYRGERIINWCVRCGTALSDLEVEHEEVDGTLYYVKYFLSNRKKAITIATTRPETMFGDTAVAVNLNDPRYRDLIDGEAILPIVGRRLPIIGDDAIDPDFGTGALKVTPGHDPVDFEIGQRHGLAILTAIGDDGVMTAEAGPFQGLERSQARKEIVAQLEHDGTLARTEVYRHSIGHCQRCHTIVEPLVSKQWFVKIKPLAAPAIRAVTEGKIKIVPQRFARVYTNWMENIRDWCISRQLWWGHRIPVWHCDNCEVLTVSVEDPTHCTQCGSSSITQDPDVLDTWFSSGLWTHSTLGWPDNTADLDYFYPTSVMETGYDILFFWVARMIMMGIENVGVPPFHTVFLHGLVRDAEGAKMSKTRRNVLDPLKLIDMYGTDALRFALTTGTAPGNDLRLSKDKLESSRNFANKLWNASRFVLSSLNKTGSLHGWHHLPKLTHREDQWIVSRLNRVMDQVNRYLERFEIGEAQREIYEFLWSEFCDWYIELAKVRLREGLEPSPTLVLIHVLEATLRMLHPFMPFITEEVWQKLNSRIPREGNLPKSIMIAPYPRADQSCFDPQAEKSMQHIIKISGRIRNIRAEYKVNPSDQVRVSIAAPIDSALRVLKSERKSMENLTRSSIAVSNKLPNEIPGTIKFVQNDVIVAVHLSIDLRTERERLTRELKESSDNLKRVETLLSNIDFIAKAPDKVVENERERAANLRERSNRLHEILSQFPD